MKTLLNLSVALLLLLAATTTTISLVSSAIDKAHIAFYYETGCPDCRNYVLGDLENVRKNLDDYIDIELIPFGKAKISDNGNNITCQHGPDECFGNILQTCTLKSFGFEKAYQLMKCMFQSKNFYQTYENAPECCQQLGLNFDLLQFCVYSDLGFNFTKQMAEKNPNLSYVPWVTVNGQRVTGDLKQYICQNHLKNQNIAACNKH